ncbi:MAG: hypothetical protein WBW62_10680 [Solirubrobacterales bacterium]
MSETEHLGVLNSDIETTPEHIRELTHAVTPHFSLQVRNRVRRLIEPLPEGHPARAEGERQIARLEALSQNSGQPGVDPTPYSH